MAYLVPLALTAQRNGITVGVATKTNALLDQLVFKEVPAPWRRRYAHPIPMQSL